MAQDDDVTNPLTPLLEKPAEVSTATAFEQAWAALVALLRASVPEILTTLVLLLGMMLALRLGRRGFVLLRDRSHMDNELAGILQRVLRWGVIILTLLAVCQVWGVLGNVWAAATATVTLVAIGFVAVWSVLSNVLCSLILMAGRPFRVGDRLRFPPDDIEGTVVAVTLVSTRLRTDDGDELQIPNNLFFQRIIQRTPRGRVKMQIPQQGEDALRPAPAEPRSNSVVDEPEQD